MQPITIHAREVSVSAKTFTVTAYNGDKLTLRGWDLPVVLDLSKLVLAPKLVAVLDHDGEKRVGHIDSVDNNGRRLILSGVLSAATPWRDEVLQSHRDGYGWEASIEAEADDAIELPSGKSQSVNGRTIDGPAYITVSTLFGFSFVTRGADRSTEVAIAASAASVARRRPTYTPSRYFPPTNVRFNPGDSFTFTPNVTRIYR